MVSTEIKKNALHSRQTMRPCDQWEGGVVVIGKSAAVIFVDKLD